MKTITTIHVPRKLRFDAAVAVALIRVLASGADTAELVPQPREWDGAGIEKGHVAVGLDAGGRGLLAGWDGSRVISLVEQVVRLMATQDDQVHLRQLVTYVNLLRTGASPSRALAPNATAEAHLVLEKVSPHALFMGYRALRLPDAAIVDLMTTNVAAWLADARDYSRCMAIASSARTFADGRVAFVESENDRRVLRALFRRGTHVVVYYGGTASHDIGVVFSQNTPHWAGRLEILRVITEAGEELSPTGWSVGEKRRVIGWDRRRNVASNVDPYALLAAAIRVVEAGPAGRSAR